MPDFENQDLPLSQETMSGTTIEQPLAESHEGIVESAEELERKEELVEQSVNQDKKDGEIYNDVLKKVQEGGTDVGILIREKRAQSIVEEGYTNHALENSMAFKGTEMRQKPILFGKKKWEQDNDEAEEFKKKQFISIANKTKVLTGILMKAAEELNSGRDINSVINSSDNSLEKAATDGVVEFVGDTIDTVSMIAGLEDAIKKTQEMSKEDILEERSEDHDKKYSPDEDNQDKLAELKDKIWEKL